MANPDDSDILKEILEAPIDEPMFHIKIESKEDGVILDTEVPAVIFIYEEGGDFDSSLTMRGRGLGPYTMWGWLNWALEAHKLQTLNGTDTPEPLPGEDI